MKRFDVAVVGGGPAGCVAAMQFARSGADVVIFDARRDSRTRPGEALPPEINPVLKRLKLWDAFVQTDPLECPGILSYWADGPPSETEFLRNANGCGWHVDRRRFDAALAESARIAGVSIVASERILSVRRGCGEWTLTTHASQEFRAAFVVDASGQNGMRICDLPTARNFDDRLIGLFLAFNGCGDDRRTLIEASAEGWWYSAPLPGRSTACCLLVDPTYYSAQGISLALELERAPKVLARVNGLRIAESRVVLVSSSVRGVLAGPGWASVGDAAVSYDPISGYGILSALESGEALAEALPRGALDEYVALLQRRFASYCVQRAAYYRQARRTRHGAFWQCRVIPTFAASRAMVTESDGF